MREMEAIMYGKVQNKDLCVKRSVRWKLVYLIF